jgi:hypothetical protein
MLTNGDHPYEISSRHGKSSITIESYSSISDYITNIALEIYQIKKNLVMKNSQKFVIFVLSLLEICEFHRKEFYVFHVIL